MVENQARWAVGEARRVSGGNARGNGRAPEQDDLSFAELATMLLRERRLLVALPLAAAFLVAVITVITPRTYTSTGSFVPYAGESAASRAMGLAAQLGFILPTAGNAYSPDFYVELLRSREILGRVVDSEFEVTIPGLFPGREAVRRGNLVEVLELESGSPGRDREKAMEALAEMTSLSTGRLSGTVTLSVSTRWPELSQQIAERMLTLVDEFNRVQRQSQAAAERLFIEERLATVRQELSDAEAELQTFLQRNRAFESSPELRFEHDRLQREVVMRQQLYSSLAQGYEQARIDEVRNTPVITVVQAPETPVLPDRRGLVLKVASALIAGGMLAIVLAVAKQLFWSHGQAERVRSDELARLTRETLHDLRRPWRLLRPPTVTARSGQSQ
ncbi:MAG TPA: Wzz/FepE/Etk N-terminal domain-containing protein [Longimicrobiales bacterium]|nr:Wzz/FepE/Etk N-terminal domain-containing protein [Longimicrobiales bacterium]